jgi:RimJ/RimL family protein N-acetyltransferase
MLIGKSVSIGPFVPGDYTAMYCWANDIAAARLDTAFRPVHLVDIVRQCENAGQDQTRVSFAVRKRTDPKIIGYLHIHNISSVHRSADIGIRIGEEKFRGQGYGTEAMGLAMQYCWDHLNLQRLTLIVFRNNARAIRVYRAVGFRKEGLLKKMLFIDGTWIDVLVMAAFRPPRRKSAGGRTNRERQRTQVAPAEMAAQSAAA